MVEINCLGDFCPVPLIRLKQCTALQTGEEVMLVTDHSCVCESIRDHCRKAGLSLRIVEPVNGVWELYIRHGEP